MSTVTRSGVGYADLVKAIDAVRACVADASIALIVGRLDGLDSINARFGYSAGDRLIDQFHTKLNKLVRTHDKSVRLGGGRFAFIIHNPLHEGHAMLAADKIGRIAEEWIEQDGSRMRPEIWMGCAMASAAEQTSADVLHRAEIAMRQSRGADKRILMSGADESAHGTTATHPLFDARKAIENGEFRVHYQPQFCLQTGSLVGAEALVRWASPDGLLAPGRFMNELERARALMPLLQFIVNNTSREMSRWMRRAPELTISINSSANDLEDADLVEIMSEVLSMWNVDPQRLTLEITETSLMRNPDVGIATLHALRELGMRTSIDDFGTGYSSLTWLKDLPVDELKIDRAFVQRIVSDRKDRRIVEAIIDLGHAMGMSVVAEGIETEGMLHVLRDAQCDIGQGYFYSQPLSSAEFERTWLVDAPRQARPAADVPG